MAKEVTSRTGPPAHHRRGKHVDFKEDEHSLGTTPSANRLPLSREPTPVRLDDACKTIPVRPISRDPSEAGLDLRVPQPHGLHEDLDRVAARDELREDRGDGPRRPPPHLLREGIAELPHRDGPVVRDEERL